MENPLIVVHSQTVADPATSIAQPIVIQMPVPEAGSGWIELSIGFMTLLGALGWPIAICLIVWWFRDGIRAKLVDVTGVDILGVKLQIEETKEKASTLIEEPEDIANSPTEGGGTSATSPGPKVLVPPWAELDQRFESLARTDPRMAILYQWGLLEERVHKLGYLSRTPARAATTGRIIDFIDASGSVSHEIIAVLRDLRGIRNMVAHSLGETGFTRTDAESFRDASLPVLQHFDQAIEHWENAPSP